MYKRILLFCLTVVCCAIAVQAQHVTVAGRITDDDSHKPIEFASILMKENGYWAITDADGMFSIKNMPMGKATLTIQCLGYATRQLTIDITKDIPRLHITLKQETLKLDEVTVTAQRKQNEATTSYTIDRTALDNQQILNVANIATLLPGGKTVNPSLMNDSRISLRSGNQERGNASFGTAVEVDGVRLSNNATLGETLGTSTRNISMSNIESIEVVTGIPSVEYGDLSNGVVKVNTRKGKSPFIVEGSINQHTRQLAINKGFELGRNGGILNVSLEHARSFSDAASPYTAYQRNNLSLHYMNTFLRETTPLTLKIGMTGNVGGYNKDSDPDKELDEYANVRDNAFRGHVEMQWLLNKSWITNLSFKGSLAYADKRSEDYTARSSVGTQPLVHSMTEGYFIAEDYALNPNAPIVLGPTGYWYEQSFTDSKPLDYSLRLKADWTHRFGKVLNTLMVGAELTGSKNHGQGRYFADRRYAADGWREDRYDSYPAMNNLALYAEEKISFATSKHSLIEVTAGLREDLTIISGSDYGTVGSLSPRVNSRYIFWRNQRKRWISDFSIHAGWGKSVKLPSFQVLYPSTRYYDQQVFSTPSTANNTSFYAFYTHPSKAVYNPDLKWQYTNQTDIGVEFTIKGTRVSLSAFHHRTHNPYMASRVFTPYSYNYTPVESIEAALNNIRENYISKEYTAKGLTPPDELPAFLNLLPENRIFMINQTTGVVTMRDATGMTNPYLPDYLSYSTRNTYLSNTRYVNGTTLDRYGLGWIIDFKQIKPLRTTIRIDGNYYYYKGLDNQLFADIPLSNATMSDGRPYQYIGYYRGCDATSAGSMASASISNGAISKQLNVNTTITTHLPKLRLIIALRVECSLYQYRRALSEFSDGSSRGMVLTDKADYFGTPYDGNSENQFVTLYPEYYSTWEKPDERIPFAETFRWAKDNDQTLYNDLSRLVIKSNYAYTMNPNRISPYYSANLSITKEIGDHVTLSFYANNFFNNMRSIRSTQTDLEESLFGKAYIPKYYYGLSLKLKL